MENKDLQKRMMMQYRVGEYTFKFLLNKRVELQEKIKELKEELRVLESATDLIIQYQGLRVQLVADGLDKHIEAIDNE